MFLCNVWTELMNKKYLGNNWRLDTSYIKVYITFFFIKNKFNKNSEAQIALK